MGPLAGVRVIELAGMGPGPFAAMMLADMGADVIRLDRFAGDGELPDTERRVRGHDPSRYVMHRGRRSVAVDLKHPRAGELVLRLVEHADALIEGFRPGVAERLGLSPDTCLARNPRLVYGRMTGWGQDGPLASRAGHDINYIALSGALANFARAGQPPVPPVNLVGDMGGGGLMLAFGVVCAVLHARRSGQGHGGQVVDAAIVDGSAALTAMLYGLRAQGRWSDTPGANFADTGAPYYDVYQTADGRHVVVGAIEPRFYNVLLRHLGLPPEDERQQNDQAAWPEKKRLFARIFRTRSRDEWAEVFAGTDACVTPVLTLDEAARHPHNQARGTFAELDGITQPAPAPRFSATRPGLTRRPPRPGEHTAEVLAELGFEPGEIAGYRDAKVIG
jgi:alpha-methylacyl-CoA racemase